MQIVVLHYLHSHHFSLKEDIAQQFYALPSSSHDQHIFVDLVGDSEDYANSFLLTGLSLAIPGVRQICPVIILRILDYRHRVPSI